MLENLFKNLGLRPIELKTYLTLLEQGACPAGVLSRKLGCARSSLYGFLGSLSAQGLVVQSEARGIKTWRAEDPKKLSALLANKVQSWEKLKSDFDQFLPHLIARQSHDCLTPRFSLFEGAEGVKGILRDILLYRDMVTQCFWPARDMMDILGVGFMHNHNLQRIRQNLYIQSIWPANKVVDLKTHPFWGLVRTLNEKFE
jgi:predicted transcriptional regulator